MTSQLPTLDNVVPRQTNENSGSVDVRLPHVLDVQPFSNEDRPLLDEVRAVLEKYGATKRFGLSLLHSHFPLADDEVLVEDTDEVKRVQTIRPIKASEVPADALRTLWRFDTHRPESPVCRLNMQYH